MLISLGMLMLSATQIYTIFTVQLFAFLNLLPVEANIIAYSFANKTAIFDDLPARFGYQIPSDGLKGFLIGARPENACEPIDPPPRDNMTDVFIVLIKRFDCNFDIKVLNAQRAGYKAAIVHNVDSNDLISMGSNDVDVMKQIDIPSVFVSEETAISLKEEYYYEAGGHVALFPSSIWLLASLMFIVGMFFIIIIVRMFEYFCEQRRPRRGRLAKEQVEKLPSRKYKKGDSLDVCVICLEEYEEGDKLRVLPCSHAYHTKCVDRWLTSRKTCPVCKQKVVSSRSHCDHVREEADSSLNESEVSESTPLLRSMASTSTHSVSITSGGSPLEQDEDSTDIEDEVLDISQEEIVVEEELVQVQQCNLPLE